MQHMHEIVACNIQERGESFYNPKLPGIVEKLAEAGILEDSNGAKVVWTEDKEGGSPPLMVQKSDGGFGYARCAENDIRYCIFLFFCGQGFALL